MSELFDDIPNISRMQRIWQGQFAANVVNVSDRASVIIPDLDVSLRLDGARWNQRLAVGFPAKGDDCLVVFDNNMEPWVICWWPFA